MYSTTSARLLPLPLKWMAFRMAAGPDHSLGQPFCSALFPCRQGVSCRLEAGTRLVLLPDQHIDRLASSSNEARSRSSSRIAMLARPTTDPLGSQFVSA